MQTSTLVQGPLNLGGRIITIGATIYNLEAGDNPASYPAPLKVFLDAEARERAVEAEIQQIADRLRARLRAQNGVTVVPAHAVMRAARSLNRLTQLETWISNNKASNDLGLRLAYGAENITQAELVAVDATQGAAIFAAARAL
jgi:hypothetical protein